MVCFKWQLTACWNETNDMHLFNGYKVKSRELVGHCLGDRKLCSCWRYLYDSHTHTYSMRSNGRNWVPVIAWTYLDPSCFLIRAISRSVSVSTHADIFYLEGHQFCDLTCSPLTQADWLTKLIEVFININKIIYVRYTVNLLHLAVYSSFLGKKWLLLNQVYCTLLNVMHTYM